MAALELRRSGAPGCLSEEQWRTVLRCAMHPRRLTGLSCGGPTRAQRALHRGSLGGGGVGFAGRAAKRRLVDLLDKCWHSAERIALRLEAPLDEDSAQMWTLLASMPRLFHLELSMADCKGPWLSDPDVSAATNTQFFLKNKKTLGNFVPRKRFFEKNV